MTITIPSTTYAPLRRTSYFTEFGTGEGSEFQTARRRAATLDMPPLDASSCTLLSVLTHVHEPRRVLEIGTGAGISAAHIALAAPAAEITTVDVDPTHTALAQQLFDELALEPQIHPVVADAADYLPTVPDASMDLVYIDTAKPLVLDFYEHALRILRHRGLLIFDNQWWSGRPTRPDVFARHEDRQTHQLNARAKDDPRVTGGLLDVGDGLLVLVKVV